MFCIIQESDDASFNLAIEELLLKSSKEEYLIIGINNPSVIIGKHQLAHREINARFVVENNIPVIRRISGGGTVFHDKGNLNFTFIRNSEAGRQVDFRKHTKPVIDFLQSLGVEAKFEGKTDIKTCGLKISGNSEHVYRNRILHHGTLLFSSSLDMMRDSLRNDSSCYTTRAVVSNPSSVMNLNEIIKDFRNIYEFSSAMINYFLQNIDGTVMYELSSSERDEGRLLASSKYNTWEWNYAYGPDYSFTNSFQINKKKHNCCLYVNDGIIRKCSIEGGDPMHSVAKRLIGCRHLVPDVLKIFEEEKIMLSNDEVYSFF